MKLKDYNLLEVPSLSHNVGIWDSFGGLEDYEWNQ